MSPTAPDAAVQASPRPPAAASPGPAIFHVTHWKAGSQWILRILIGCTPDLIVPPPLKETHHLLQPVRPGGVYPTVYLTKEQFDQMRLPSAWRRFVVIRDLRDTLVSYYYSLKFSHPVIAPIVVEERAALQSMGTVDGLLYTLEKWLPFCARIQESWLRAGEPLIRYEDLLTRDLEILERVLIDECELPVRRGRLREIVLANRFERLTNRPPGREDRSCHERIGIAGDWRRHFSPRLKDAFKRRYGDLLVRLGYERDLDW